MYHIWDHLFLGHKSIYLLNTGQWTMSIQQMIPGIQKVCK